MRKCLRWSALIGAALAVPSPAAPALADHGQLSAFALHNFFSGATARGTLKSGRLYEIKYAADGSMTLRVGSGYTERG